MDHHNNKECRYTTDSTDTLFDCIIPYIHPNDLNSVSLTSRSLYALDSLTRKHVTLRNCYSIPPSRLVTRFPNLESLTLVGKHNKPQFPVGWGGIVDHWLREIVTSLKRLECVGFKRMIVFDKDLERVAGMCGDRIRDLRIEACMGFTTDGLFCVAKNCSQLRVFSLDESLVIEKSGKWLRELAERCKGIQTLSLFRTNLTIWDGGDSFVKIAKNCGKTLVKLRIGQCHLKDVTDIFRYAVKLEDFSSETYIDEGEEVPDVKFPPTMCSVAFLLGIQQDIPVILSFAHQLTKFDLRFSMFNVVDHCAIINLCSNLEVLYTKDTIGDLGLQFVGDVCKKLRRIKIEKSGQVGSVSDSGLMALAKGCFELESLHITINNISNEVLECIGANLKKLYDFGMVLHNKWNVSDLPLDNRIRALLNGCTKLEKLSIHLLPGGLTDVGCGYIGKYGQNLRYINLGFCPESDTGLVELSKGCPKLQKLEMSGCDFSQQALVTFMLNVTSLRYLWVEEYHAFQSGHDLFAMVRPFWKMELIKYQPNVANAPEGPTQQKPPSLLAYYSLAEQRNDFPNSVIPLYPFVEFD